MTREAQQLEVDQNYDAFQRILTTLLPEYRDQHALMHARQVIEFYPSVGEAFRAGRARFGDQPFSIQEVTDEPIDLGFYSHALL